MAGLSTKRRIGCRGLSGPNGKILQKLLTVSVDQAKADPLGCHQRSGPGSSTDDYDHYVGLPTKRQLETIIGIGASIIGFVWDLF